MRLKKSSIKILNPIWLALGLSLVIATPCAANFYTIIGPDGHPMIVQKPEEKTKKTEIKPLKNVVDVQETEKIQNEVEKKVSSDITQKMISTLETKPREAKIEPRVKVEAQAVDNFKNSDLAQNSTQAPKVEKKGIKSLEAKSSTIPSSLDSKVVQAQQLKPAIAVIKTTEKPSQNTVNIPLSAQNSTALKEDDLQKDFDNKNFAVIDGEKYVNNEYLEDQEFNLEGKKRFYMTPEFGAVHGRYETIERKKGLSASLLNRIRGNGDDVEKKAIVLAPTYSRLAQKDVVQNLEQSCFVGKKVLKAKDLSMKNQEVGVWPVAPIKEKFAYEVIKLDSQVQNVLFTSYASSSSAPTYYWPLVVFLDHKGCVLEGVSGFKNEDMQANNIEFAAMEGVLRKPDNAAYMFLTPLSSAVDVENKQLTNHGQIKLSVIQ